MVTDVDAPARLRRLEIGVTCLMIGCFVAFGTSVGVSEHSTFGTFVIDAVLLVNGLVWHGWRSRVREMRRLLDRIDRGPPLDN
jgi:hypothetical protein